MIHLKIEDNIIAKIVKGVKILKPLLSFGYDFHYQAPYGMRSKRAKRSLLVPGNHVYIGWLPRIRQFCEKAGHELRIDGHFDTIEAEQKPSLRGLTFRHDQAQLIKKAIDSQRGTVIAPTGSGKTVVGMGIISAFPNRKALFLCPTIAIMKQTIKEFKKYDFPCSQVASGIHDFSGRVVVSTIQTYRRLNLIDLSTLWDIIITDEFHLASKSEATLEQILSQTLAPVRIGLSATPPSNPERRLILEGLLGPKIGTLTLQEAIEVGILSEPHVDLIAVPKERGATAYRKYHEIYDHFIVHNAIRNKLIAEKVRDCYKNDISMVIFATQIEHIKEIHKYLDQVSVKHLMVHGSTSADKREDMRQQMINGELKCVISSIVWREGVNIPNLGGVMLAGLGKAEQAVIQSIGRALRRTKKKRHAWIFDFLDPYRYLAEHSIARISVYVKNGWL